MDLSPVHIVLLLKIVTILTDEVVWGQTEIAEYDN